MEMQHFQGLAEFKFADPEAAVRGEFVGYASTFGNIDQGGDIVDPAAFTATLQAKKASDVLMLWGHDARQPPIGKWVSLEVDSKGLLAKGQLTLDMPRARDVHAAMKEGTVKGLSIGFMVPAGGSVLERGGAVRRIKTIDLMEISVVNFPMNTRAQVQRVKGAGMTIREFETFLRDEGGFSHSEAKAIAATGFKAKPDPRDEDGAEIAAQLRRNLRILKP